MSRSGWFRGRRGSHCAKRRWIHRGGRTYRLGGGIRRTVDYLVTCFPSVCGVRGCFLPVTRRRTNKASSAARSHSWAVGLGGFAAAGAAIVPPSRGVDAARSFASRGGTRVDERLGERVAER